jgi:protein-disulfide isomerase
MKRRKDKETIRNNRDTKTPSKKTISIGLVVSVAAILGLVIIFLPSGTLHNLTTGQSGNGMGKSNINGNGNGVDRTAKAYVIKQISSPAYPTAPALGSNKAKITVVEFGDYRCHFCARFYRYTSGSIIQNFVDTGKVRFLFKDFIVNDKPGDTTSMLAAIASYCAADQGKYWQYHNEVYNNSKGEDVAWVTPGVLKQFANDVKIPDTNKFSTCLDSHTHTNVVQQNNDLAGNIGLQATPSFILLSTSKSQPGPYLIEGAQPYSVFQQAIEKIESSA